MMPGAAETCAAAAELFPRNIYRLEALKHV